MDKSFLCKGDGDFKVLQLTDCHIGGGFLSSKADKKALMAIEALIKYAKPDLIVLTGDMAFPIPWYSGSFSSMKPAKILGNFLEDFNIPFAFTFGNHDCEAFSSHSKEEVAAYYASLPHCFFSGTVEGISGDSNYTVKIVNASGELNRLLVFIDSNGYRVPGFKGFYSGFDCIHEDQIQWVEREVASLQEAKAICFFHIPPREIRDAWWNMQEGGIEARYRFGTVSEKDQYFGVSCIENDFFERMVKTRKVQAMFFGHDHLNTLTIDYRGIQLSYGMSIDYLAYKKISELKNQRGGLLIQLGEKNQLKTKLLPLWAVTGKQRGGKLRVEKD